eukprot:scaffold3586_cov164-Amphora_coffeaeformis.AAC.10
MPPLTCRSDEEMVKVNLSSDSSSVEGRALPLAETCITGTPSFRVGGTRTNARAFKKWILVVWVVPDMVDSCLLSIGCAVLIEVLFLLHSTVQRHTQRERETWFDRYDVGSEKEAMRPRKVLYQWSNNNNG